MGSEALKYSNHVTRKHWFRNDEKNFGEDKDFMTETIIFLGCIALGIGLGIMAYREGAGLSPRRKKEIPEKEYIYFCRSSFCMGDDVLAPNMSRFEYEKETFSEEDMKECITKYLAWYLPRFLWKGYCNGELVATANCIGEGEEDYKIDIELAENWQELLADNRVIYFDHDCEREYKVGIEESKNYSLERAEKIYSLYLDLKAEKRSRKVTVIVDVILLVAYFVAVIVDIAFIK